MKTPGKTTNSVQTLSYLVSRYYRYLTQGVLGLEPIGWFAGPLQIEQKTWFDVYSLGKIHPAKCWIFNRFVHKVGKMLYGDSRVSSARILFVLLIFFKFSQSYNV